MKKDSLCVLVPRDRSDGVVQPVYPSTAFQYLDEGEQYYPRYFNTPNQRAVVEKLCKLESAEDGLVFGSGMAAISTTMMALLSPGDHAVLLDGLYGGSHTFALDEFQRLGISFTFAPGTAQQICQAVEANTKAIIVESPTNPLIKVIELRSIASFAQSKGITTVIDNTFASPVNQNPIPMGFDLVIHSGTKYLGGHSDLSCGAVLGTKPIIQRVGAKARHYGGSINALTCYLLDRSLKTLSIRVQRQNENALKLAELMSGNKLIKSVHYPGLACSPDHEIAARQMSGFGGMLAFELANSVHAISFLKKLSVITPALSLGGIESTICMPARTSHRHIPAADRHRLGITDGLIRMSTGIEHIDDLIADVEQALTG